MTRNSRWVATLMALLGLLLMTGCFSKRREDSLGAVKIPSGGGPLKADVWDAAEKSNKADLEASSKFVWPLPWNSYADRMTIHNSRSQAKGASGQPLANHAGANRLVWNDLLIPYYFISLPLGSKYAEYEYQKGTEAPIARQGFATNLFWASDWKSGEPPSGRSFSASGIPLFFTNVAIDRKTAKLDSHLGIHNYLWSLGPRVARFNFEGSLQDLQGEDNLPMIDPSMKSIFANSQYDHWEGYYTNPLYLGGVLGSILWSDYHFKGTTETWDDEYSAHGPLLGMMFYTRTHLKSTNKSGAVEQTELSKLILGGWIWRTWVQKDGNGKTMNEVEGPIFGIFGWGYKDGKKVTRIFWYPPIQTDDTGSHITTTKKTEPAKAADKKVEEKKPAETKKPEAKPAPAAKPAAEKKAPEPAKK